MGGGRQRVSGPGRQENQHKRAATSFEGKLAVIRHFQLSKDMRFTIEHFYPGLEKVAARAKARVVYRWVKERHTIEAYANSAKTSRQLRIRRLGSATTLGAEGERGLVAWLRRAYKRGDQVSSETLRTRALQIARARRVPEGAFIASSAWMKRFLERHRDALRVSDSDTEDAAEETEDEASDEMAAAEAERAVATAAANGRVDDGDYAYDHEDDGSSITSESGNKRSSSNSAPARATAPPRERVNTTTTSPVKRSPPPPLSDARVVFMYPRASRATSALRTLLPRPAVMSPPAAPSPAVAPAAPSQTPPAERAPAAPAAEAESSVHVTMTAEEEERAIRRRRAEIEERKAELLNESIRFDNVLKRIKIAEENALARKRLREAGVPQKEIEALLPVLRE
ncbi:hypothetical protein PybrP1_005928 [[Pythium] brassicae (nom. inval.)]|nr:hypothetical protein PybrP1_005928 [[Pythium] brassicae (nom. inval.)]